MRKAAKSAGRLALYIFLTAVLAWICARLMPNFDIRGPFLLASPYFAVSLAGIVISLFLKDSFEEETDAREVDLIQTTALEFGFGPVTVQLEQRAKGPRLVITLPNESVLRISESWPQLPDAAKRFEVVRILAEAKRPLSDRIVETVCGYGPIAVGMVIAGLNLWTILAFHSAVAVYIAVKMFRLENHLVKADLRAFRITKDLKGALDYVSAESSNSFPTVNSGKRTAALCEEARKLGITLAPL